jgi:DNA-binding NarL/FixJ family response regulator
MENSILIADDHPLFREALKYILNSVLPSATTQETTNYVETKAVLAKQKFDLVFLDLNMPDSNELTDLALLKKLYPHVPIVVVSAHEAPDIIRTCLAYNASGYIVKSSSPTEIKLAIQNILAGETYRPSWIDLQYYEAQEQTSIAADQVGTLTPSQLKILIEIGKGKLNKQIAYDLNISEATVKAHITSIFKKLSINNRTQAVLFIKEHQLENPTLKGTIASESLS